RLLRLHRQHDERRVVPYRLRRVANATQSGKARGERGALRGQRLDDRDVGGAAAAREDAADERRRHVAAADEDEAAHEMASAVAGDAMRAPKIAEPIRTSVAPSATAASRSALMPIDSVSRPSPSRRAASKACLNAPNCARTAVSAASAAAMPMKPRRRS